MEMLSQVLQRFIEVRKSSYGFRRLQNIQCFILDASREKTVPPLQVSESLYEKTT